VVSAVGLLSRLILELKFVEIDIEQKVPFELNKDQEYRLPLHTNFVPNFHILFQLNR
jgi:hypothetical protein